MPEPDEPLPPLRRDLEIVPLEHEGKPMYVLSDSEAADDRALGLSPGGMALASLMDGRLNATQVAGAFKKETGSEVGAEQVLDVAKRLEEAGLLDTERSRQARRARLQAFKDAPARPAQFCGRGGYPSDKKELEAYLSKFGPLPAAPSLGPAAGVIAPHIDMHRGGAAYAKAYAALAQSPAPDVVVALGVAHASPPSPWAFTRKAYETPLGPVAVDEELYAAMAKKLWYDPLDDEAAHRREHSLEFQAVWLRHLWGEKTPKWVPILSSTFERWAEDRSPSTVETVDRALTEIGEVLARESKRRSVLVLCGVDFAHVGPRFGDDLELTPELEKKIEAEDRVSLEAALALDAEGFYASVIKDGHWRKVCGLSATYAGLRWMKALSGGKAKGEVTAYGQAPDPMGGIVSFAGAIYK